MRYEKQDQPLPGMGHDPYDWGLTDEQIDALFEEHLRRCDGQQPGCDH